MACIFRGWSGLAKSRHSTLSKLVRFRCTESNLTASEDARDPPLQNSEPGAPKSNARIKNELSYRLPTVSLPPKLADSVKEVLKRERIIRVFGLLHMNSVDYSKKEALAAAKLLMDHLSSREKMTKTKGVHCNVNC